MEYIYSQADTLGGKPKVGDSDCVALVRVYAGAPNHRAWKQGARVLGNKSIRKGTAIATFVKGRYPSRSNGNHAALFLRHGPAGDGFWVMDQWAKPNKKSISSRYISKQNKKQNADGTWPRASDNADAYSIIE